MSKQLISATLVLIVGFMIAGAILMTSTQSVEAAEDKEGPKPGCDYFCTFRISGVCVMWERVCPASSN